MASRPYKRTVILINRRFQLRLAVYVCSMVLGLSFIFPLITYNLFGYLIRYVEADPQGPNLEYLYGTRRDVMIMMAGTQAAFIILTFLSSLFLGHRIAGPLYKLRTYFAKVRDGDYRHDVSFRKFDHFQEMATEFNGMLESIRYRMKELSSRIEKALPDAGPNGRPELEKALLSIRSTIDLQSPAELEASESVPAKASQ